MLMVDTQVIEIFIMQFRIRNKEIGILSNFAFFYKKSAAACKSFFLCLNVTHISAHNHKLDIRVIGS